MDREIASIDVVNLRIVRNDDHIHFGVCDFIICVLNVSMYDDINILSSSIAMCFKWQFL